MGKECSKDERIFRYTTFHDAIHSIDDDIKKELSNTNLSSKKYCRYNIINKNVLKKYPFLKNKKFDEETAKNIVFQYKDLIYELEERNFLKIDKRFSFNFPENFIFINQDFMEVIFEYIDDEYKKFLKNKFEFIIGGECLIKRNIINENFYFRYITLYKELEEEEGNYTDFFLFIKNEQKREAAVNYIVQNNIWEYFKKIKYNYKNEYKKIIDEKGQEVGYIVRAIELEHIEAYLSRKKQKELEKEIINKIPKIQLENKLDNKEQIQNTNSKAEISINQMQNNINNNKDNNMNNINMQSNFQNMQMQMNMNMMNNNMNMNFNNINNNNNMPNWNNFNMNNLNNMNINQSLYERINYLTNENFTLKNTIQLKDNEIKELKQRIDNLVNNTTQLVDFNKIRVVQFISMDHTIICGIKCLLTDTFAEVEEKLYKIYPQYRETNNAFQVDGRTILRFKTIAENNIQEGHGVQILKIE